MAKSEYNLNEYTDYYTGTTSPAPLIEKQEDQPLVLRKSKIIPKKNNSFFSMFFFSGLLFCAMLVPLLYKQYQVSAASIRVEKIKIEIKEMENNIKNLELDLNRNLDMNTVQNYAESNLNMGYANQEQLVCVEFLNNNNEIIQTQVIAPVEEEIQTQKADLPQNQEEILPQEDITQDANITQENMAQNQEYITQEENLASAPETNAVLSSGQENSAKSQEYIID